MGISNSTRGNHQENAVFSEYELGSRHKQQNRHARLQWSKSERSIQVDSSNSSVHENKRLRRTKSHKTLEDAVRQLIVQETHPKKIQTTVNSLFDTSHSLERAKTMTTRETAELSFWQTARPPQNLLAKKSRTGQARSLDSNEQTKIEPEKNIHPSGDRSVENQVLEVPSALKQGSMPPVQRQVSFGGVNKPLNTVHEFRKDDAVDKGTKIVQKPLQTRNKDDGKEINIKRTQCRVCHNNLSNVTLLPCHHRVVCHPCAREVLATETIQTRRIRTFYCFVCKIKIENYSIDIL